jgi:hypothetical protein
VFNNVQELEVLLTSALEVTASLGFVARPGRTFAIVNGFKCACPVAALAVMKKVLPLTPPREFNDPTLTDVLSKLHDVCNISDEQKSQLRNVAYGFDGGRPERGSQDAVYADLGRKLRPARAT